MNRLAASLPLLALAAWGAAALMLHASPTAPAPTPDVIDPNIAKASAEADADAGISTDKTQDPTTPYAKALLAYKSAKYSDAKALINDADQATPGDARIEMLKVRILTELHEFDAAHQVLNSLYDRSDLPPGYASALLLTAGDLNLRQRHFEEATKSYESYLQTNPADPDAKLKLVYARLGAGDLVSAGRYTSELKPSDPASPAYYFAHAALVRTNGSGDEQEDIEQARTIYGILLTNRYLKTYLEFFSNKSSTPSASDSNNAPSGKAQ